MASKKKSLLVYTAIAIFIVFTFGTYITTKKNENQLIPRCKDCNVLLISLSSFNVRHSMLYGHERDTDHFTKKWLKNGIIFDNHFAVSTWPFQSNMSLFTGLLPINHQVYLSKFHSKDNKEDVLSSSVITLPELFKKNGYRTLFFGGAPHQAILSLSAGFERGFDVKFPKGLHVHEDINNLTSELDKLKDKKFFAFASSVRLHFPYFITPNFKNKKFNDRKNNTSFPKDEMEFEEKYIEYKNKLISSQASDLSFKIRPSQFLINTLDPEQTEDIEVLNDVYDQAIQYTDIFIDQIFEYLKNNNLLSKTVVIITSDVAPNLLDAYTNNSNSKKQYNLFSDQYLENVSRIPLFIYHPIRNSIQTESGASQHLRIKKLTNTCDIYNLVSELVDLESIPKNDGINFFGTHSNERTISLGNSYNYYRDYEYYARNLSHILIKDKSGINVIDVHKKEISYYEDRKLPEQYAPLLEEINLEIKKAR